MPLRLLPLLLLAAALAGCGRSDAPASAALYDEDDVLLLPITADDLLERVRDADADLVVVNFWASWCAPCREEFPDLLRYDREHADAAVRFVSIDFEDDIPHAVAFLREQGFTGETYLRTGRDGPFIDAVSPDWTGALPATAVYTRKGTQIAFWEGKVSYAELAARVEAARSDLPTTPS